MVPNCSPAIQQSPGDHIPIIEVKKGGYAGGLAKTPRADLRESCKNLREFCKIHENPLAGFRFLPQIEAEKNAVDVEQ